MGPGPGRRSSCMRIGGNVRSLPIASCDDEGLLERRLPTDGGVGKTGRIENPSSWPRIRRSFNVGTESERSDEVRLCTDEARVE